MDYIIEPENKLVRHGPKVIQEIRREHNLDKEEDREQAIAIVDKWVKSQDHFLKKDFSKGYIEKSLITCKGSIERAKKQIDKLCTLKTLLPKYFQTTNVLDSDVKIIIEKGYFALVPQLTDEYHRIVIIKVFTDSLITSQDYTLLFKFCTVVAEYLKIHDYCRGFTLLADVYECSTADVLSKLNLLELQQFLPVVTEGYGTRIKGIIFLTNSKFIDGFVKIIKTLFSEKIAGRIHVANSVEALKEFVQVDILPVEYGGKEQSAAVLHGNLIKSLSVESHQEVMKIMNKACTDESKRQTDKFNEQYMGMPGSFRTLSLD